MGEGMRELTHKAKLREWYVRVAECRGSGLGVKAWCAEQGVALKTYYNWEREIVKEAARQHVLAAPPSAGMLVQVKPDALPSGDDNTIEASITIRHGESEIIMPAGSGAEAIAELVKALNRHV